MMDRVSMQTVQSHQRTEPQRSRVRHTAYIALWITAFASTPRVLEAQYFGRQKVQYEDFDWQVMQTTHFDVHYYPEEETVTHDAARMAERWYARLSRVFQHEFEKKPLILYADHPDFQQTNVINSALSEGTGGVTEGLRSRVIMPFTGSYRDNDHVLGHELVHVFQYDIANEVGGGGIIGIAQLPLWLVEGMAEYLTLGRRDAHTAMWLRDAALAGELPTIDQLTHDPRFFPYRYGQALWAYIAGRWGDRAVTELFRFATRAGWDTALEYVLGLNSQQLSEQWISSIRSAYLPLVAGRQRPQDAGDRVLYDDEVGAFNLAPVISPDGRYVAYFTRAGLFSIDLYIADARSGHTVKKLTSPNHSPHFDALSFISSAGTWSPDGQKFAYPVFAEGDMELVITDVSSAHMERKIHFGKIGAIANPSWSPDGSRIAFSGASGGSSDLYVLELASGSVQQLTDDRFADLQPTWSPDGREIAFATDRGPETDLERLVFGPMDLAVIDVASQVVRVLSLFKDAKHINPQFSPDGRDLYFVSDRQGFSDLYRLDLATGSIYQITRLATGVSGITMLSPAMSVAQRSGRMLFSVFEHAGYNVYGLDAERTRGTTVQAGSESAHAAAELLPPAEGAGSGLVAEYLADATTGLPESARTMARADYQSRLKLDYISQPSFGAGATRFGPALSGGVLAYFSDMLGNRQLAAAVQAQGSFKDVGAQVLYRNAARRWNWGAAAAHIPYLTASTVATGGDTQGNLIVAQILDRVFVDQAVAFAARPISQTRRWEVSGGVTRLSYDREIREYLLAPSGQIIDERTTDDAETLGPLTFFEISTALVGDNASFAFTSPVAGRRYRFEMSPTFGTLQYQTTLADYRRYVFAQPMSFAFRALHYGRHGSDGDNARLTPLFLGYEAFIRGYAAESFETTECTTNANQNACPEFDRLFGSRIAVANFEVRIPLFGTEGLGLVKLPMLPTEISPFVDVGMAWWGRDAIDPLSGEAASRPRLAFERNTLARVPVVSTGVSARINLSGYLILETYYAYPFQRPGKGAHFGFNIAPGW